MGGGKVAQIALKLRGRVHPVMQGEPGLETPATIIRRSRGQEAAAGFAWACRVGGDPKSFFQPDLFRIANKVPGIARVDQRVEAKRNRISRGKVAASR